MAEDSFPKPIQSAPELFCFTFKKRPREDGYVTYVPSFPDPGQKKLHPVWCCSGQAWSCDCGQSVAPDYVRWQGRAKVIFWVWASGGGGLAFGGYPFLPCERKAQLFGYLFWQMLHFAEKGGVKIKLLLRPFTDAQTTTKLPNAQD